MKNELIYSADFNTFGETDCRADFCSDGTFLYQSSMAQSIFFVDYNDPCFCREIIIDDNGSYMFRDLRADMSLYCYIDEELEAGSIKEPEAPKMPTWVLEYPFVDFVPENGLEETIENAFAKMREEG